MINKIAQYAGSGREVQNTLHKQLKSWEYEGTRRGVLTYQEKPKMPIRLNWKATMGGRWLRRWLRRGHGRRIGLLEWTNNNYREKKEMLFFILPGGEEWLFVELKREWFMKEDGVEFMLRRWANVIFIY